MSLNHLVRGAKNLSPSERKKFGGSTSTSTKTSSGTFGTQKISDLRKKFSRGIKTPTIDKSKIPSNFGTTSTSNTATKSSTTQKSAIGRSGIPLSQITQTSKNPFNPFTDPVRFNQYELDRNLLHPANVIASDIQKQEGPITSKQIEAYAQATGLSRGEALKQLGRAFPEKVFTPAVTEAQTQVPQIFSETVSGQAVTPAVGDLQQQVSGTENFQSPPKPVDLTAIPDTAIPDTAIPDTAEKPALIDTESLLDGIENLMQNLSPINVEGEPNILGILIIIAIIMIIILVI